MATITTTTSESATPAPSQRQQLLPAVGFSHSGYPPVERYQTIDGLLKSHASDLDQKPAICYPARGVADYEEHTAIDIDRYTDLAVAWYLQHDLEAAVRAVLSGRWSPIDRDNRTHRKRKPQLSLCWRHQASKSS